MAIDRTGKWWTGANAEDLAEYLHEAAADGYPADLIRHSVCGSCGGAVFAVRGDEDEGCARRQCVGCGEQAFLADSEDTWADSHPRQCRCPCGGTSFNVAVAFCLRGNGDVRWVTIGNRCTSCGILGSIADWHINYSPAAHLTELA
jgi:hypothetical protein